MQENERKTEKFRENLYYLKINYPNIYDKVKSAQLDEMRTYLLNTVYTKNNKINFHIIENSKGHYLHSNYDPFKEGERICDFNPEQIDTIAILGFGLAYHLEYILGEYEGKNKIIIEPDIRIFIESMHYISLKETLGAKNTLLLLSNDVEELYNEFTSLTQAANIYSIKFLQLAGYKNLYEDFWLELQTKLVNYLTHLVVNIRTESVFKNIWAYNFFNNIMHLSNSSNMGAFVDKFKGVPAILVSSGPSLEANIHYLKNLENKAIIVAAGSSVNALLKNGIVPHIMVGIDGGKDMSDVYNLVDRDDILLAHILNLHYDCVNKYKGPKMYMRSNVETHVAYMEDFFNMQTPAITSGGSCSNVALDYLYKLGCDPIVLIGQDLAYTNMKTHADGVLASKGITNDDIKQYEKSNQYIKIKDIFDQDIYTSKVLLTMKHWFEGYFKNNLGERTYINSSAGGAKIEFTTHMPIDQVINNYCNTEINIRNLILEIHSRCLENHGLTKDQLIDFLIFIKKSCKKAMKLSNKRLVVLKMIIEDLKEKTQESMVKKRKVMNTITGRLENTDLFKYYLWPGCKQILFAYKNYYELQSEKEQDLDKKLIILYEGLLKQFYEIEERIVLLSRITEEVIKKIDVEE